MVPREGGCAPKNLRVPAALPSGGCRPDAPGVDEERLRRLRTRSFRWNEADDTTGYCAAEIDGERVVWLRWSHVHGEGRREIGTQTQQDLERDGPPLAVPARVLAQIVAALASPST